MEIPPEGWDHESERERLRLLQSHWGCRVVKQKNGEKAAGAGSLTPSIQLTDTLASFHILWLDSFRKLFLRLRELLRQTQRTVRYCKTRVFSKSTWLALRDEKPTEEGKTRELSVVSLYFFFQASLPFFFFFLSERIHVTLERKHFTSYRCRGPGWPQLPCHTRSEVIHYNPIDEKHLCNAL